MRLDHIAYRVPDRWKTANFFIEAFGYNVAAEFQPYGDDSVSCVALKPPERGPIIVPFVLPVIVETDDDEFPVTGEYHMSPEIFVSDGKPDSVVGEWVANRNGRGGIHHLAYQVDNVAKTVALWKENGWGNFLSDDVLECPGIKQIFTEEMRVTGGIIFEFISRGPEVGFCQENVRDLMESTKYNNPPSRIFPDGPYEFVSKKDGQPYWIGDFEVDDIFHIRYEGGTSEGPFRVVDTGSEGSMPFLDYRKADD